MLTHYKNGFTYETNKTRTIYKKHERFSYYNEYIMVFGYWFENTGFSRNEVPSGEYELVNGELIRR